MKRAEGIMIFKILLIVIPVLLLAIGCAQKRNVWMGGNPSDLDRDLYECERDAAMLPVRQHFVTGQSEGRTHGESLLERAADKRMRKRLFEKCMKARGWHKSK
jgi:hypothetical protein